MFKRMLAPVAQLDRVPGYEPVGREFESLRARHLKNPVPSGLRGFYFYFQIFNFNDFATYLLLIAKKIKTNRFFHWQQGLKITVTVWQAVGIV